MSDSLSAKPKWTVSQGTYVKGTAQDCDAVVLGHHPTATVDCRDTDTIKHRCYFVDNEYIGVAAWREDLDCWLAHFYIPSDTAMVAA